MVLKAHPSLLFPSSEHAYAGLFTPGGILHPILSPFGAVIESVAHETLHESDSFKTSLHGSFYLPATQHAGESAIAIPLCVFILARAWQAVRDGNVQPRLAGKGKIYKRNWVDEFLFWGLLASFVYIAACKFVTERVIFMLMPCHLLTTALLIMLRAPVRRSGTGDWGTLIFNHYVGYAFMPILAVAFPDLRDYALPLEAHFFFIQHFFMIAVPIHFVIRRRFDIIRGPHLGLASYSFGSLVFFAFLVPVSILLGVNLNYMMSPPPGILARFGRAYRPVQMIFCVVLLLSSSALHKKLLPAISGWQEEPVLVGETPRRRRRSRDRSSSSKSTSSSSDVVTQPPVTRASTRARGRSKSPGSPERRSASRSPAGRRRSVAREKTREKDE